MKAPTRPPGSSRGNFLTWTAWLGVLLSPLLLRAAVPQVLVAYNQPNITLAWHSLPGGVYQVQCRTDLVAGDWLNLATVVATNHVASWTEAASLSGSRFYRLLLPDGTLVEPPEGAPAAPCDCSQCSRPPGGSPNLYLFSGEFHYAVEDLRIKGRGLDFVWARKYRSRVGPNTAQGNGWDFSYNVRVERFGQEVVVFDGNTRADVFQRQLDDTYAADEFFSEGSFSNNVFTLKFQDTGKWEFRALDGSAAQGRISRIEDRNGNALTFAYDGLGRLMTVTDTLGRNISVAYNGQGFIDTVTDFAGRAVRYAYCQNGDADGSFGDLKSVTSPLVTGTPNGNDFPSGKTTTYTYSKNFVVEALNHNLLTITDPKGQIWLQNSYATNQTPTDLDFDRVVARRLGYVMEVETICYVAQTPAPSNQNAIVKAIVNDRVGNVSESLYDAGNRLVNRREFTGRATPGQTTTETQNRPTNPLRTNDPSHFETRVEWNADSLPTRVFHPNGNVVSNAYGLAINPTAPRRSRANLRARTYLPGALGGDQTQLVEQFEYDTNLGGCCGFNFVTRHVDARGYETLHAYDSRGNRTNTIHRIPSITESWEYNAFGQMTAHTLPDNGSSYRRRDGFTYYSAGPQTGYLYQQIVDASTLALTTTYEYDAVGNVVRMIDPRGHDTLYTFNALNQIVRELSREVTTGSGVRYEKLTWYDANDNVVRTDVENRDETGALQSNTHFSTLTEYEILNRPTQLVQEKGSANLASTVLRYDDIPVPARPQFVLTEFQYDANRNPTLLCSPEAVNGNQPANQVQKLYDERGLLFREIRAPGDAAQSTTQHDYDANGNLTARSEGLEAGGHTNIYAYDGYNRRVSETDPMGNVPTYHYDANGNVVSERKDGELMDVIGSVGNVRLLEKTNTYDAMNRVTRAETAFFDPQTQAPIGDGFATTQTAYNDNSQVTSVTDDTGHTTLTSYDTANRRSFVTDPKTNTAAFTYDPNDNAITVTESDKSDLGSASQTFVTTYAYDNLDRLIRTVDNIGNTNRTAYDSRGNKALVTDPRTNYRRFTFDGLSRHVQTVGTLTTTGDGGGAVVAAITNSQTWDDASRLVAQADDNTNTTRYAYDALNRRIVMQTADGTLEQVGAGAVWTLGAPTPTLGGFTSGYDAYGNPLKTTDANNNVVSNTVDRLNRVTAKSVNRGPGIQGTTNELYQYDGLSRMVRAEDDDSIVVRRHDSLSNVIYEQQTLTGSPAQTVTATYDAEGNLLSCTYPGGRLVTTTYDALNRPQVIADTNGMLATYYYIGRGRVERRDYRNNTRTLYRYDGIAPNPTNDFGVRQIVAITHSNIVSHALIDDRTFTWDRAGNKTERKDIRVGGPRLTTGFQYDSADRMVRSARTPFGGATTTVEYGLDGAGNRTNVIGGPNPGSYLLDSFLPEPADRQMNQYTYTPTEHRMYDSKSNLTNYNFGMTTERKLTYDYRNQLVQHVNIANGQTTTYAYDALGRRIMRVVTGPGASAKRFLYLNWVELEEQDLAGVTQATFVHGLYIDEVLSMRRGAADLFFHSDDMHNVVAATSAAGGIVERYEYQDFGQPTFFNAAGAQIAQSAIDNPHLLTGRRYDPETGFYYYRTRHLDPVAGRFISRDAIGLWGDPTGMGNGATYVANSPATYLDPSGYGKWIAGISGQLNLCLELCTGDYTLEGWVWAGVGYESEVWGVKVWAGLSITVGGTISKGNWPQAKVPCGECKPTCPDGWWSFSQIKFTKEKSKQTAKFGVIDCSLSPSIAGCSASLDFGCSVDFLQFVPAVKAAKPALEAAGIEVKAGLQGNFSIGLCAGKNTPVAFSSAKVCIGGFVEIGKNLPKKRSQIPK